jgi:recombination protein RecT
MKPTTALAVRLDQVLSERRSQLAELLPPGIRPERLMQSIRLAMWKNPELLKCTLASLVEAALDAAALGVQPDGTSGQAWLVPFNDRDKGPVARLIIGHRGVTAIAARNGFTIDAAVVLDGDAFTFRLGTSPLLEHQPALDRPRGAVVASWATASPRAGGAPLLAVLPRTRLEEIKARSPSAKKPGSPWNDTSGPGFVGMCRKSAIRALWPLLPLADRQNVGLRIVTGDDDAGDAPSLRPSARSATRRPTVIDIDELSERGDDDDQGEFPGFADDGHEPAGP